MNAQFLVNCELSSFEYVSSFVSHEILYRIANNISCRKEKHFDEILNRKRTIYSNK